MGSPVLHGQLDSFDGAHPLADVGIVCVFVCFDCFEARATVQW